MLVLDLEYLNEKNAKASQAKSGTMKVRNLILVVLRKLEVRNI